MKYKIFKDTKHFALWINVVACAFSALWFLFSIYNFFISNNENFEFEPIIVFLISLAALLSSEYPWNYKKYTFLNSNKQNINFNLSENNQKVMIGSGENSFDLKFGSSGSGSIHIYGIGFGSQNINSLAIIPNVSNVEDITDFESQSHLSCLTAYIGDFILLKNSFGKYAALRILGADARSHGGEDIVKFSYWIL